MTHTALTGYDYGAATVPRSPVTLEELAELGELLRFTEQDRRNLRRIGDVLTDGIQDFMAQLMEWTGPVAMTAVLKEDGTIDEAYAEAAHRRFGQGFIDACTRPFDQAWLDYQHEVGRRHHRARKNVVDGAHTSPHIGLRWLLAFLEPTVETMRAFLSSRMPHEDVAGLTASWHKAMLLQVILYSAAYVPREDW